MPEHSYPYTSTDLHVYAYNCTHTLIKAHKKHTDVQISTNSHRHIYIFTNTQTCVHKHGYQYTDMSVCT